MTETEIHQICVAFYHLKTAIRDKFLQKHIKKTSACVISNSNARLCLFEQASHIKFYVSGFLLHKDQKQFHPNVQNEGR